MSGLSLGDRIQLRLISRDLDRILVELDSFRDQKPGQRLRVLLRTGRAIEGVVNTASRDHLSILAIPGDELHQIPACDLQRIQAAGPPKGQVAMSAVAIGIGGVGGIVAMSALHSVALAACATGGIVALATAGLRVWATGRRTWYTIWEAPPEPPAAA